MKKKRICKRTSTHLFNFKLSMKLSVLFLFVTVFTLRANHSPAQEARITLNVSNVSVRQLIDEIESESNFHFVYRVSDVDLTRNVSLHVEAQPIGSALQTIFKGTNTAYIIADEDREIHLTKRQPAKEPEVMAEDKTIALFKVAGTITDAGNGQALPGASVMEEGTANGTQSDADGKFALTVSSENAVLVISFIGFVTQRVSVENRANIDVLLEEESTSLDEVVVTALGVKQEKKSLGYASQSIEGDALVQSKEANMVNGLSGKIAGVTVTNSPSGIGGSSLITIRGTSSLDISKNSPLFVIDGTPISNNFFTPSDGSTRDVDYGNDAGEINPENIESINVLKGPVAAALYGSRAANGAIVITTKSGQSDGKLSVSINTGVTVETLLTMPNWQNKYGQGSNGEFEFVDGAGGGTNDGVDESWGPEMDTGAEIAQFDSPRTDGTRAGDVDVSDADIIPTAWKSHPNNVANFFETGVTVNNSISIAKSGSIGNFRAAYQDRTQKGIVPNTDLKRKNFNITSNLNLAKGLKLNTHINYLMQDSDNRPSVSYGTENIMYLWVWYGRQINTHSLRNYWQEGLEDQQQFNYNYNYHDNPYFNVYENTNSQDKDRIYGNISLNYDLGKHIDIMVRTGRDFYRDQRTKRRAFSTQAFPDGFYREDNIFFEEVNSDFLVTYSNYFGSHWDVSVSAGGNRRNQSNSYDRTTVDELINPGIYSFNNAASDITSYEEDETKRVNSLYAFGRFSYDEKLFLEVSARNDWSSTLPSNNNSYFYPAFNLSAILSDMVTLPTVVSYAKLRAAVAAVGNDTDPYKNGQTTYSNGGTYDGNAILTESSSITNAHLKPENTTSYEVGADLRFLDNRITVDFTYYENITTNQILDVPADIASGYSTRSVNLGEVNNHGEEVMLGLRPVVQPHFSWDASFNFARNRSVVSNLGGIDYTVADDGKVYIMAKEGGSISAIYGKGFQRVEDKNSEYYGKIIYDDDGTPQRTDDLVYQGDYAPKFTLGIQNHFRIKNFDVGILFDIREGGIVYSRTKMTGMAAGQLKGTLKGREDGIVGDGAVLSESGDYVANETLVTARTYYKAYYKSDNVEADSYDASYTKLREVTIGYTLPSEICKRIFARSIRLSLTGRNLMLWTQNPHFDPETISIKDGQMKPGIEYMSIPSTRAYSFNLNINF